MVAVCAFPVLILLLNSKNDSGQIGTAEVAQYKLKLVIGEI